MKLLNKLNRFISAKLSVSLSALIITLSGCAPTVVETVKLDNFCLRYESLWLEELDFKNIDEIRINDKHRITFDKFIDYATINEKEYELCKET
jgi:hypothetical protein